MVFWKCYKTLTFCLLLTRCTIPCLRLPRTTISERPRVLRTPQFFLHFWFRHVLRATTACTFSTSNLSFQKWSGPAVLCTFWLRHVLRAATACNFSSLIWPAGSAPAALHSEPTFRPSGATNHWKNMEKHSVSRLSYLFAHLDLLSSDSFSFFFSSLLFSSLTLPTSAFHLSILSEVWLLNFLRVLLLLHMTWHPEHIKSRCGLRQQGQSDANQAKLDNIAIQNQNHHIMAQNHHRILSIRNHTECFYLVFHWTMGFAISFFSCWSRYSICKKNGRNTKKIYCTLTPLFNLFYIRQGPKSKTHCPQPRALGHLICILYNL